MRMRMHGAYSIWHIAGGIGIQAIPIALIWRYIAWQLLTAAAQAQAALSNHGGRQLFTGHVEGHT
jgi:hypothetical protein